MAKAGPIPNFKNFQSTHDFWRDPDNGVVHELGQNGQAELHGGGPPAEQNSGGAIGDLRGVSGRGGAGLLEGGLEFLEALEGGLLSDAVVLRDSDLLELALVVLDGGFDRDDLVLEEALVLGRKGALVRLDGEFVLLLPVDAVFLGHVLGGLAHAHQAVSGLRVLEDGLADLFRVDAGVHVEETHAFDACADSHVDHSDG
jgi:hypothetical protein